MGCCNSSDDNKDNANVVTPEEVMQNNEQSLADQAEAEAADKAKAEEVAKAEADAEAAKAKAEKEKADAEAKAEGPKIALTFTVDKEGKVETKTVDIKAKPLGFSFKSDFTVTKVFADSVAAEAGIRVSNEVNGIWRITQVNGKEVAPDVIKEAASGLPDDDKIQKEKCVIEFATSPNIDKADKSIEFSKQGFGLTFIGNKMPLIITKVVENGQAAGLGVDQGWEIKSIGKRSMANYDYATALELVKVANSKLPAA
jgi:predicted metalloprotease with PDZ domain